MIKPDSDRYREMLKKDYKYIWQYPADKRRQELEKMKNEDSLLEQLLDINPEGDLLREIKDIEDELHMMTKVYSQQHDVVKVLRISNNWAVRARKLPRKRRTKSAIW